MEFVVGGRMRLAYSGFRLSHRAKHRQIVISRWREAEIRSGRPTDSVNRVSLSARHSMPDVRLACAY